MTESFMMQDTECTIRKLTELKELGIRLAIDDFGTGYSSLSYLQRFPVDILKIDRSFIEKISQNGEGNAVAKAIIMMGDSLKLKTIAEGIEHPEQIEALRELGCEAGQGFHFAHPLSEE
ncbi:EAL domain-containing protein, partial [Escherichia coli]|nr:EAL domain-containing protein [Escherichia coli]